MKDYYSILGVSQNATDDEVKAAYRELARKYHPDNYKDNPLASLAEEKMKEINEAYDGIVTQRKQGNSYNNNNSNYNTGGYNAGGSSSKFAQIRQLINMGRTDEAEANLNAIDNSSRNAEWNFLMGAVYYRKGFIVDARRYFETAASMEPNNMEYRQAINNMKGNVNNYGPYRNGGMGNTMGGCSPCDMCLGLMCADSCCDCLGAGC